MEKINKHISDLLLQSNGINVSKYDASFLNKSLRRRMTATQCESEEEYAVFLKQNTIEGKCLFDSLQISYSEFFRNPLTVSVLERIILPSLLSGKRNTRRKEIRIWSAACAAGQEAYSIAMILEELRNDDLKNINYRIFATDQNEEQVKEAQRGQYSADSLQKINMYRLNKWFTRQDETYNIKPELNRLFGI
jgi:chemotaxis protein methyltransferase CheR